MSFPGKENQSLNHAPSSSRLTMVDEQDFNLTHNSSDSFTCNDSFAQQQDPLTNQTRLLLEDTFKLTSQFKPPSEAMVKQQESIFSYPAQQSQESDSYRRGQPTADTILPNGNFQNQPTDAA